jgi:hypothetical protein
MSDQNRTVESAARKNGDGICYRHCAYGSPR